MEALLAKQAEWMMETGQSKNAAEVVRELKSWVLALHDPLKWVGQQFSQVFRSRVYSELAKLLLSLKRLDVGRPKNTTAPLCIFFVVKCRVSFEGLNHWTFCCASAKSWWMLCPLSNFALGISNFWRAGVPLTKPCKIFEFARGRNVCFMFFSFVNLGVCVSIVLCVSFWKFLWFVYLLWLALWTSLTVYPENGEMVSYHDFVPVTLLLDSIEWWCAYACAHVMLFGVKCFFCHFA